MSFELLMIRFVSIEESSPYLYLEMEHINALTWQRMPRSDCSHYLSLFTVWTHCAWSIVRIRIIPWGQLDKAQTVHSSCTCTIYKTRILGFLFTTIYPIESLPRSGYSKYICVCSAKTSNEFESVGRWTHIPETKKGRARTQATHSSLSYSYSRSCNISYYFLYSIALWNILTELNTYTKTIHPFHFSWPFAGPIEKLVFPHIINQLKWAAVHGTFYASYKQSIYLLCTCTCTSRRAKVTNWPDQGIYGLRIKTTGTTVN